MVRRFSPVLKLFLLAVIAVCLSSAFVPAAVQSRIAQEIDESRSVTMSGNVHPLARPQFDQGRADESAVLDRIMVTFTPTRAQQADLDTLLQQQQDPKSANYHKWLTPEQYADRYGLSEADLSKVAGWLESQGFRVVEKARSRTYIAFSGSTARAEAAFKTEIHRYVVNGEDHFANATEPAVPVALANVVSGIHGLNDFTPKPRGVRFARPVFTSNISGNHFLSPDDFATIFNIKALWNIGIDGSGQKIAVMGQTDINLGDIATFRSVSGLPANTPQVVLAAGSADPGTKSGDLQEADLDIEWAGAVAKNATIIYVNSSRGAFDSLFYAISQNLAPVLSISYGDCEPHYTTGEINSLITMTQQANAQGQTVVGPAGDSGGADCDFNTSTTSQIKSASHGLQVDAPASLPFVTAIGGTTLSTLSQYWSANNNNNNGSASGYIPEVVWNDTSFEIANGGSLAATGGGASKGMTLFPTQSANFAKPIWQTGTGVPNDGVRDVPDISFPASFDSVGYLTCSGGSCVNGYRQANNNLNVVGGTSAGTPVFAAIVALINQQTNSAGQGNVNPRLYQIAASSSDVFHDITSGDNKVPCTAGTPDCPTGGPIGFSAGTGYDLATGLGSIDAYNLVTEWSGGPQPPADFQYAPTTGPTTATVNACAPTTVLTSVYSLHGFNDPVTLSCSVGPQLTGVSCSVSPLTISGAGTATVTLTRQQLAGLRVPPGPRRSFPWTASSLAFAVALVLSGKSGVRKTKAAVLTVTFVLLLAGSLFMVACGGGGGSSASSFTSTQTTTAPLIGFGSSSVSFGNQNINTTGNNSVTVTNSGTASLQITALSVSGANASDFAVTSSTPITVAPSANAPINVSFTPKGSCARTASLNVTDNAAGSPHTVTLSGNGTLPPVTDTVTVTATGVTAKTKTQTVQFTVTAN